MLLRLEGGDHLASRMRLGGVVAAMLLRLEGGDHPRRMGPQPVHGLRRNAAPPRRRRSPFNGGCRRGRSRSCRNAAPPRRRRSRRCRRSSRRHPVRRRNAAPPRRRRSPLDAPTVEWCWLTAAMLLRLEGGDHSDHRTQSGDGRRAPQCCSASKAEITHRPSSDAGRGQIGRNAAPPRRRRSRPMRCHASTAS